MNIEIELQSIKTALKSHIENLKCQKSVCNDEVIIEYLNIQIQASNDALYKLTGKSFKKLKDLLNEN